MKQQGYDVAVICNRSKYSEVIAKREGIRVLNLAMERAVSALPDLSGLLKLVSLLNRLKPDIVNASTPKAALLGLVAAKLANVPIRIYTVCGLRYETARGARRRVLKTAERVMSACAHTVVAVSASVKREYARPVCASQKRCASLLGLVEQRR